MLAFALAGTAHAEIITLFDGAAGTLPQAQPWLTYIGTAAPTIAPDGVALDTRATVDTLAGIFNHQLLALPKTWLIKNPAFPRLDPAEGFTLSFWLALPDETHLNSNRAGFSVIVIGSDRRGIELGLWGEPHLGAGRILVHASRGRQLRHHCQDPLCAERLWFDLHAAGEWHADPDRPDA